MLENSRGGAGGARGGQEDMIAITFVGCLWLDGSESCGGSSRFS